MFWLRYLLYLSPLIFLIGLVMLYGRVSGLQIDTERTSLVYAIQEPIGPLNPLAPQSGVTREISELIFEPLLTRDDDLMLRPNLLESWSEETVITVRCASEEAATGVEERIASEASQDGLNITAVDRVDTVLTAAIAGLDPKLETRFLALFTEEELGQYEMARLTMQHSVRDSLDTFLRSAVERAQVKMIEYEGDGAATLFLQGDTDLFFREMELYYESNRSLRPEIELLGNGCHTATRTMTLDLRDEVYWHDGSRFDAEDVIRSYEFVMSPVSPYPIGASFWFVDSIEKVDPLTIRVLVNDAPAMMLESWEKLPILPRGFLQQPAREIDWAGFFEQPIGLGPYRLEQRRADGGVSLLANDRYFGGTPSEKRVIYRSYESLESQLFSLRGGQVDVLEPDSRLARWAERHPGLLEPIQDVARYQTFLAWNLDREPFQSLEFRRAMAQAIDVKELLEEEPDRFEVPTWSLFFPGTRYCETPMPLPEFDVVAADVRLGRLGWKRRRDEAYRSSEETGQPLQFRILVNQDSEREVELARSLADRWATVGAEVEVEALPWSELVMERLATRDFDAAILDWEVPLERDRLSTWHSKAAVPGGGNISGLRDQEVDLLVTSLRYERDEKKLQNLAESLQARIGELQPCLFLCNSGRRLAMRRNSLVVMRPGQNEAERPLGVGKSGIRQTRPWWQRSGQPGAGERLSGAAP
ncbi:MAG: ABC transporter substrate-binding protein [Verrucomicrobiota bacterium]